MLTRMRHFLKRLNSRQQGTVSVEFAILVPIFLVLVFGIIDFGHGWYMKQVITEASREGARYASRYNTDGSGNWVKPANLGSLASGTIQTYLANKFAPLLPSDANMLVTPGGTAYTSANPNPGDDISVEVKATKTWWILNKLLPSMGSSQDLKSTTWMKIE